MSPLANRSSECRLRFDKGDGMRRIVFVLVAFVMALIPAVVAAQDAEDDNGFLLRVNGTVVVPEGEHVDTLIVINGDILIEGTAETVVAIDSDAVIRGAVEDEVVVISGNLELADQSRVNDVVLESSDLQRAPGAIVAGTIDEDDNWWFDLSLGVLPLLVFWLAFSVFVIAAALLFAGVGGRQLSSAALLISNEVGPTILATLIVWIGLPIAAVLVFVTVIGIPIGIGIFLFVLPALWFAGYLVAATRLGAAITRRALGAVGVQHPYMPALVGVLVLQAVGIIPALGWLIVWLAGMLGGGALALVAWRAWRDREPATPEQAEQPPPAPEAPVTRQG
jgi:hypothetical protein